MTINTTKQAYSQFGEDTLKSGEHKMTNREWIESLSDEEFAYEMCEISNCEGGCDYCNFHTTDWLKAEHKEVSE